MKYKALFLDIDGVLLDKEDDTSKETWNLLHSLINNGVYVSFVTARPYGLASHLVKKLGGIGTHVLDNGAFIYDVTTQKTFHSSKLLPNEVKKIVIQVLTNSVTARFGISDELRFYGNNKYYEDLKRYMPLENIFLYDRQNYKANSIWIRDLETNLALKLENMLKPNTNTYQYTQNNGSHSVFVHPLDADKSHGAERLAKILDINLAETIFIGDDSRDMTTLKLVGFPACPNNAIDSVKSLCRYVSAYDFSKSIVDIIEVV